MCRRPAAGLYVLCVPSPTRHPEYCLYLGLPQDSVEIPVQLFLHIVCRSFVFPLLP